MYKTNGQSCNQSTLSRIKQLSDLFFIVSLQAFHQIVEHMPACFSAAVCKASKPYPCGQPLCSFLCTKKLPISRKFIKWSRWQDLNLRPFGPEPNALPNCATPRKWSQWRDSNPWPAVYETAALPTEPHWHLSFATSRIRLTRQNYTRIAFACQPFFHTFFASFWKLCRSASKPGIPCFPPRTNMVY